MKKPVLTLGTKIPIKSSDDPKGYVYRYITGIRLGYSHWHGKRMWQYRLSNNLNDVGILDDWELEVITLKRIGDDK